MLDKSATFVKSVCPICGSNDSVKIHRISYGENNVLEKIEFTGAIPVINLVKCKNCSHHYADYILSDEAFKVYYKKNSAFYNSYINGVTEEQNYDRATNQSIISEIEKYKTGGNVLEVGCGLGNLLADFREKGWSSYGVEPSPFASNYAIQTLKLNVKNEYLSSETYENDYFDVVVMNDVVEHLTDMREMMGLIKNKLKHDGILVLITGNVLSLNSRINRSTWQYYASREHISFFSLQSMKELMNRSGFGKTYIVSINHKGGYVKNLRLLIENIVFRKPMNLILPLIFKLAPDFRKHPLINTRTCSKTGVIVSHHAFDHLLAIGQLGENSELLLLKT